MPASSFEFLPATSVSVGAIGRPGQRVFYLQAGDAEQSISLKLEKQQVAALAQALDQVLDEMEKREAPALSVLAEPTPLDESLDMPDFIVGQIGLAYDEEKRLLLLLVHELVEEGDTTGAVAHIWITVGQMRTLSRQAKAIVAQGRPICPVCERPIDPDGHFCPGRNGHSTGHEPT